MSTPLSTTPMRLIVMGVSGCGKSTMAAALGERLGLDMVDGDDLHLPESVAKMRSGIALEDADRWPWLDRIGAYLSQPHPQGRVVACSALKRVYRDRIRAQAGDVCFVFLDGDFELIKQRMRYTDFDTASKMMGAANDPEMDSSKAESADDCIDAINFKRDPDHDFFTDGMAMHDLQAAIAFMNGEQSALLDLLTDHSDIASACAASGLSTGVAGNGSCDCTSSRSL